MKARLEKIANLKRNTENPRLIKDERFDKLVQSIIDFPTMLELRPIVVNAELVVLGGNMRLAACAKAGLKEVPIFVADNLTPEQQNEFIIKDNVGFGDWDNDILANEWNIDDLNRWGLDLWGADEDETPDAPPEEKLKQLKIDIAPEYYDEAVDIVAYWADLDANVGKMVLDYLKDKKALKRRENG
jgi:hypothetical protein